MASPPETHKPLSAEEFARRPDPGHPEELEKGRIVAIPLPGFRHGRICSRVGRVLGNFVDDHDLGTILNNDSGIVTERGPDSVRGADVAFYSYRRLPKGEDPVGYPDVPPDLVVEVLSPDDRWQRVLAKVAEYLDAGVGIVCVIDPARRNLHLYEGEESVRILHEDDTLCLPTIFPEFSVQVGRLLD